MSSSIAIPLTQLTVLCKIAYCAVKCEHWLNARRGEKGLLHLCRAQQLHLCMPVPPDEEEVGVLGTLGLVLTTERLLPAGILGFPLLSMGMVTVPAELLVTTTTWPAVFWKVA